MAFLGIFVYSLAVVVVIISIFCILGYIAAVLFTIGLYLYKSNRRKVGIICTIIGITMSVILLLIFTYYCIIFTKDTIEMYNEDNQYERVIYEYNNKYFGVLYEEV